MPPEAIDFTQRAQLTELMDEPCSRVVLRACLRDIARINRWTLAHRPILRWLDSMLVELKSHRQPTRILDVGSGYGDGLRRLERWARERGIAVELLGLDVNPDATAIAADATPPTSHIQWITSDIFAFEPDQPFDLVLSSLFTHHLRENEIVRFLQWMEANARVGWFVNDLSRAAAPYHIFGTLAKLIRLHPFVQNDGPVSIARAFVAEDWKRMCTAAGLSANAVAIQPFRPARLCVSRKKIE
jgi:SAM-dependent methyltransferase